MVCASDASAPRARIRGSPGGVKAGARPPAALTSARRDSIVALTMRQSRARPCWWRGDVIDATVRSFRPAFRLPGRGVF